MPRWLASRPKDGFETRSATLSLKSEVARQPLPSQWCLAGQASCRQFQSACFQGTACVEGGLLFAALCLSRAGSQVHDCLAGLSCRPETKL